MIVEFRLPDLGEGLPEAEIVQWHVAVGDTVTLNQTIADVETAKAIVELPSPYAGTVRELRHADGDVVAVGDVLIAFEVAGAEPDAASAAPSAPAAPATPAEPAAAASEESAQPNLVGYGAAPRGAARPQRRARVGARAAATDTAVLEAAPHDVVTASPPDDTRHERPRSTPPVRKLAKDLGIDLALVEASGATGIITRADVEAFAARTAPAESAATAARPAAPRVERGERETRIPIRGVRKHTAEAMVRSAFTAPHVTTFLTIDVTATTRLLAGLKADRRLADHRIGILAVAAKAVCLALAAHPELNSRWDEAAGEIVQYHYVNLGIAAATERGLVVPNVKDADGLTLVELSDAIGDLAETARAGKAGLDVLTGGTFSITNFGVFGMDAGTPILNPGEAGILGLGAVRRRPWEHKGEIALRDVLTLSLSFDHRLADGEQGSLFLRDVADVLGDPGRAMLLR
ncbi:2-oxo acid dehydrogenase subunit E2 [Microbacterium saccharophilum]|uniref:Dihydrolipoamide acetyltransferase component of pyruvate dehydrogenase complex n=1 Tax=Microbacterium saccharophilum TaxID=1213358 RepID=A0A5C8HS22_9MICO|nr:dihydrolipoamide acetyltransferase family protein [Microbacterium saccharophilum]TXK08633.1 2-oxo acid dehydrogenase subunit E2 [Microbacterium saccharophilum]GEP48979.1 dihydrolipoamide acetyltransferase component of pyruvate dehydrogenase complex [Microbacterium saccharophilum]